MRPLVAIAITCAIAGTTVAPVSAQSAPVTIRLADEAAQIEVNDAIRSDDGSIVTVHGVLRNNSNRDVLFGQTAEIYLLDFKNRRRYGVISDSQLNCLCSPNNVANVSPSGAIHFWAKFPAPPEGVTTVSLGWGTAEPTAVQITR